MFVFLNNDEKSSVVKGRILGIDPGTNVMGYGILQVDGNHAEVVVMGVLELKDLDSPYDKLHRIFTKVTSIIEEYKPTELAIESPFFGKNVQSMLKLGRAQGVCIAAAMNFDLSVNEYAPLRIKQAITGHGDAAKEQVAMILQRILHFDDIPKYLDATDGLAAAYCHFLQLKSPMSANDGAKSWKDFIAKNPNRISK